MKSHFISQFTQIMSDTVHALPDLLVYESLQNKMLRMGGFDPQKIYTGVKNLEKRRILKKSKNGSYRFTSKGQRWFQDSVRKYVGIKYPAWDQKWRIVAFDIPEEFHSGRDALRRRLRFLGFYMLQKSIFVFPYPCEEELGDICKILKISDYVDIFLAESIGFREAEMRKHFEIK
jgi:phenylacetic acid degradation operon negative regulatory protein